jgi:hypothetical protein
MTSLETLFKSHVKLFKKKKKKVKKVIKEKYTLNCTPVAILHSSPDPQCKKHEEAESYTIFDTLMTWRHNDGNVNAHSCIISVVTSGLSLRSHLPVLQSKLKKKHEYIYFKKCRQKES